MGSPQLQKESGLMRKTFRHLVLAALAALVFSPAVLATGGGYYNHPINWQNTGNLYYTVIGGPANTCGDLWTYRNGGPWVKQAVGWACTDSSGNVQKGPWTWAGQATDETAYAKIEWPPGGDFTTTDKHIWDKTCAVTTETVSGSPPSTFSGSATDTAWGAGFDPSWTKCKVYYRNQTTGYYWDASTNTYSLTSDPLLNCSVSGMPSFSVTWSASQVPSGGSHTSGDCYEWEARVTDGSCSQEDIHYFCVP